MNPTRDCPTKQENGNSSRAQSQDALDSSSASSLSFFAEHSDAPNSSGRANDRSTDELKSGECSPKAPMNEALKSEKAFIEFVMSLPPKNNSEHHHKSIDLAIPKNKSSATMANTTKVGLDHLDNLCKLMESLSELRDTNNKLQRRVQYLEDLKTLHDMHKEINEDGPYGSEDAISNKKRPYELKKSATETCCPKKDENHSYRTPSKYQNRRGRTQSADGQRRERSKSVGHDDSAEDTKSKRIFPRWSKVKEAFGWESDRKDSAKPKSDGDAGSVRTPRRCSDDSHQSYHHPNSPTWSQDYASLHSSLEDVSEILHAGRWKRSSVASEKHVMHLEAPKDALRRQKSTPSPGSEKIISYKDATDLKPKSSTIERDTYSHQDYKDDGKRGKSPWGRVKTIIERRRDSLKRRSIRRDHACVDCDSMPPKKDSDFKSYSDYMDSSTKQLVLTDSCKHKHFVPEPIVIDQEVDYGGPRTPSSSPTFHRKSRWTRVKKVLKGKKEDERDPSLSTPASPNSVQDGHFTFDAIEEISQASYDDSREIKRVGSDSHVHQLVLSEPTCDLMLQLQRNLSEDFHKKIMEWERIRSFGNASCSPHWDRKPSTTIRNRKKSERDDKNIKPKLKDLSWLEKELQKIEKEKLRLSKERQKYEERALRLEKLKETVLNAKESNKREVLVRTSAGEFRFEGISDAFTKKLYEWETKRGVGPELSTIALLDSSRLTVQQAIGPKAGPLQRVVSRSESSMVDIGQPSHNSSNSLPSLKISDSIDVERTNHPSRANSEPDLSTLVAFKNGTTVSVSNLSRQVGDSLDDEITSPGVSRESEEDELDKKRNDSETYYGLLEENVILLEQLKDKEDICQKLENELEVLDKKVDVMNKHHTQETERYREKLWEMHKPGATPRDVQCCLRTMAQLRKRIEVLEKFTEKLKNDRESVEDSFRYHSKQQEDMTLDLLQKMSELQAAGSSTAECDTKESIPQRMDISAVERLQDLSALLVKQTQELQDTLSAKTRQICELRWELLHRDLSTVKLETELHTHTAHRKRSKYAHYRSHSSEDSPVVPLLQELDHGKSTIITEAYYNATTPESEFQATQLTNTVQQLNREVLKLANATDYPHQANCDNNESYQTKVNPVETWTRKGWQPRTKDKAKKITVRRNSADNISVVSGKEERWKQNISSSVDSDDSSDDGYSKITFCPPSRNNFSLNPNAERLLMSSGEHPPRGYLQRKKKLQKSGKGSYSPSRRRSNTFHNKRDFEKPVMSDNVPQKCHSFRYPSEKSIDNSKSRKISTINIRNLLGEVKYQEFLNKRAEMCQNNHGQLPVSMSKDAQRTVSDIKANSRWLREVSSDSKIPLLIEVQYRTENLSRDKNSGKHPVRSMSDKHQKETAAERRENIQKKKNKKQLTSPDLFSNMDDSVNTRSHIANFSHRTISRVHSIDECKRSFKELTKQSQNICQVQSEHPINIPPLNTDAATVTIQLPKRKWKKSLPKASEEHPEQSVTIVIPKKRSLSSEQEFENSLGDSFKANQTDKCKQKTGSEKTSNSTIRCFTDSHLYKECNRDLNESFMNNNIGPEPCLNSPEICEYGVTTAHGVLQTEQISRKRKAEDSDSLKESTGEETRNIIKDPQYRTPNSKLLSVHTKCEQENFNCSSPSCMKSPSAPHLDWRKVCAKKVSREDASNVRSLIEKYNQVAKNQSLRSQNSSNLSSPLSSRKISSPIFNSRSEHAVLAHSFSTPTTPSVVSTSSFYNPLVFKPINLDLFPKSPPSSPLSIARSEAIKKAKEQFILSQTTCNFLNRKQSNKSCPSSTKMCDKKSSENHVPILSKTENIASKRLDDDRISTSSMDSMSYVIFRTGETCQESRLSKRLMDYSKTDSETLERNKLKTSKSLSNSSIFKSVLSSDFKMPTSFLKLRRSKRKKDMATVSQLCRQSLLLTTEDVAKVSNQSTHKSCPSSPELKSKNQVKSSWFHRNIFRHK